MDGALSPTPSHVPATLTCPPFTYTLFINESYWEHTPFDPTCDETIFSHDALAWHGFSFEDLYPPTHVFHLYYGFVTITVVYGLRVFHLMVYLSCTPHFSPLTLGKSWLDYIGRTLDPNDIEISFPMSFGRVFIYNISFLGYTQNITR